MQTIKHDAKPAVTQTVVVSEAVPETFDLIGLSAEQMAALFIIVGNCSGNNRVLYPLYQQLYPSLGLRNDDCSPRADIIKDGRLVVNIGTITDVLSKRRL